MRRFRLDPCAGVVVLVSAFALAPLFQPGFLWGADAFLHLFRTFELEEAVAQGELLPRWIPSFAFGYGYPLFNFYPPLFYYLSALAHGVGLPWEAAMKAVPAASVPIAGIGMYLLGRDLFGRSKTRLGERAGLLSAVAYMYWPYAMLNVYARSAGPESLATALLPWALWALRRGVGRQEATLSTDWAWSAGAGAALAVIMLTHNISGLLFTPLFVIYGGFCVAIERSAIGWRGGLVRLVVATALGLGLSAVYWLPAWAEVSYTATGSFGGLDPTLFRSLIEPKNLIQRSFVFYYDDVSFWFGRIGIIPAAVATASAGALFVLGGSRRWQLAFFLAMVVAATIAMTTDAEPLWHALSAFTFIQFAWRLLAYVGLGAAVGIGALASFGGRRWQWAVVVALTPLLVASAILGVRPHYISSEVATRPYAAHYEQVGRTIGTTVPAQFLPTTVADVELLGKTRAEPWPDAETEPESEIAIDAHNGRRVAMRTRAGEPFRLRLHILAFPGWTAEIDGRPTPIGADGPLGLVSVQVPSGEHQVAVFFGGTPWRQLGLAITAIAVLIGLLIIAPVRGRRVAGLAALMLVLAVGLGLLFSLRSASAGRLTPVRLDLSERLRLIGWRAEQGGDALRVSLVWHVLADGGDLLDVIRLVDADGRVVASKTKAPQYGESPASWWRRNEVVLDEQELWLPPGTAAGNYRLEVGVREASASSSSEAGLASLGTVALAAALPRPAPALKSVGAVLGGEIVLVGYRLQGGQAGGVRRLAPGDALDLSLFWQTLVDVTEDYSIFVHLHDEARRNIAQEDSSPYVAVWDAGRTVEERFRLVVSEDAAPGVYYLSAGMYRRDTMVRLPVVQAGVALPESRVILEPLKVPPPRWAPPRELLDAIFKSGITLIGADLPSVSSAPLRPGDNINVVLQWRADARVDRNYTVFLHLTDLQGRVVAQHDAQPREGAYPTWAWDAGEVVADPRRLVAPPDLPAGDYLLKAGLYTWPDGVRSQLVAGGDQVVVGSLRVEARP